MFFLRSLSERLCSHTKRTGGVQLTFPDANARDATQWNSPSKSIGAKSLFNSSTTSTTSISFDTPTRPTRPMHRPSLSILTSRDPFIAEDTSPSPTRTRTMYVKSSASQFMTRDRVGSIESDTSSPGPQTPYDDSGSSLPPLSALSKSSWYPSHRAERMPVISSAPLQRTQTAPILEHPSRAVSQPVTPVNKRAPSHGASHSVDWRFHSASRPQLPLHAHSYSVNNDNDPSPLNCLIDEEYSQGSTSTVPIPESPTSAPTLRHALLVQQERYRALKTQLRETESAKEQQDRQIALLQEEADKRAEELQGLRLLLADAEKVQKNQASTSSELGSPLTRSVSMPFLSAPDHEVDVPSSARPGESFESQDGHSAKCNLGLGIDLDVGDRSKSKRYGKAMMRPPPPPPPRGKLPTPTITPGNLTRSKSRTSLKRCRETSTTPTPKEKIVLAVPVAPLNITRKKDVVQRRVDQYAEMDLLSRELRELKTSNALGSS